MPKCHFNKAFYKAISIKLSIKHMKGGRVLGVDPLYKSSFKFSIYFLFVF